VTERSRGKKERKVKEGNKQRFAIVEHLLFFPIQLKLRGGSNLDELPPLCLPASRFSLSSPFPHTFTMSFIQFTTPASYEFSNAAFISKSYVSG
jgi:hypothetical protein